MNKNYHLDEAVEGAVYEIVSIDDERISKEIGIDAGMTVVVLKKALSSIVQFGYSQFELDLDILKKIEVAPI